MSGLLFLALAAFFVAMFALVWIAPGQPDASVALVMIGALAFASFAVGAPCALAPRFCLAL